MLMAATCAFGLHERAADLRDEQRGVFGDLALHSWRINPFRLTNSLLWWRFQSIDRDGSRFRAAIKADSAACAASSQITRRVYAITAQLRRQIQASGRTGFHAQSATFALFHADGHFSSRLARHASPTYRIRPLDVTTPAPGDSIGAMRDTVPSLAVEGRAMMGLPPLEFDAPRRKSTCPPIPL